MKALVAIVLQQCLMAVSAIPVEVDPSIASARVETPHGIFEGFVYEVRSNNGSDLPFNVDIYLGIPDTKSPTGELRFEKTQPLSPLSAELALTTVHSAQVFSPACPSHASQAGEPEIPASNLPKEATAE
jgi:hypothetical protein